MHEREKTHEWHDTMELEGALEPGVEDAEVMEDEEPRRLSVHRRRSSKRKSVSSSRRASSRAELEDLHASVVELAHAGKEAAAEEEELEPVAAAAGHLRVALSVAVCAALAFDVLSLGLRGSSTPFVDWWDMLGTAAYIRGRQPHYALRRRSSWLWALFLVVDSFVIFDIAGRSTRTFLRGTPQMAPLLLLSDYIVYALLPVHFFPGDHLFTLLEGDDQQLVMAAVWATTKVRSLQSILEEASGRHLATPMDPLRLLWLLLFSLEIGSVVSRIDTNVTRFTLHECLTRFPRGVVSWLFSWTVASSVVAALLLVGSANLQRSPVPLLWLGPQVLAWVAIFYRYANGTLERVLRHHGLLKHHRPQLRQLRRLHKESLERLDVRMEEVPDKVVRESIALTHSLIITLEQLSEDSKLDLEELLRQLELFARQLEDDRAERRRGSSSSKTSSMSNTSGRRKAE